MSNQPATISRRAFLQYSFATGCGVAIGGIALSRSSVADSASAASPEALDATATREAELREISELQTQIAQPVVCATETPPPPTPTATPVPIVPAGTPLTYDTIWTVTVLSISPIGAAPTTAPQGQFMQLNFTASHSTASIEFFPYPDFRLVDAAGRIAAVDQAINTEILGNSWVFGIEPGVEENRSFIFDVAVDAGDSFVLESTNDPLFRVGVSVVQRG